MRDLHLRTALGRFGPPRRPLLVDRPRLSRDDGTTLRPASVRSFSEHAPMEEAQEIATSVYGQRGGRREVPSAGGIYELSIYVAPHRGGPLVQTDAFGRTADAGTCGPMAEAFFGQIEGNPALMIILADPTSYEARYGARGLRYIYLEAGHVGQELLRRASALDLVTCPLGAFHDDGIIEATGTRLTGHLPVYAVAVGEAP